MTAETASHREPGHRDCVWRDAFVVAIRALPPFSGPLRLPIVVFNRQVSSFSLTLPAIVSRAGIVDVLPVLLGGMAVLARPLVRVRVASICLSFLRRGLVVFPAAFVHIVMSGTELLGSHIQFEPFFFTCLSCFG